MKRVALVLFLIGAAATATATRAPGPALSPDSASYLGAAESWVQGQGLRIPMAEWWSPVDSEPLRHFPPGFPLLIGLLNEAGLSPVGAARCLHVLSGGALLALAGWTVGSASGSALAAALAGVCALLTPALAQTFFPVLSEPLFLCLVALFFVLAVRAETGALALGLVAAAAAMVRYAGVALGMSAALLGLIGPGALAARARRVLSASLPTLVALGIWRRASGHFREYQTVSEGLGAEFQRALFTLESWLVPLLPPGVVRSGLTALLLLAVFACVPRALRQAGDDAEGAQRRALMRSAALFSLCYAAVLTGSRLFADPAIEFDWRTLSPLLLTGELCFFAALPALVQRASSATRALIAGLLLAWALGSSAELIKLGAKARRVGYGFEAASWQDSQLAAWLRRYGPDYELYTNNPAALWHLSGLHSRLLPRKDDAATLQRFGARFWQRRAALVAFPYALDEGVEPAWLARELGCAAPLLLDRGHVWLSDAAHPSR